MKHKDGKPINHPSKNRSLSLAITVIVLCGLSFYFGGVFNSGNNGVAINTIQKAIDSPKQSSGSLQIKPFNFPECSGDYQDYTPCTDPKVLLKVNTNTNSCPFVDAASVIFVEGNFNVDLSMHDFTEMEKVWNL